MRIYAHRNATKEEIEHLIEHHISKRQLARLSCIMIRKASGCDCGEDFSPVERLWFRALCSCVEDLALKPTGRHAEDYWSSRRFFAKGDHEGVCFVINVDAGYVIRILKTVKLL